MLTFYGVGIVFLVGFLVFLVSFIILVVNAMKIRSTQTEDELNSREQTVRNSAIVAAIGFIIICSIIGYLYYSIRTLIQDFTDEMKIY